MKKVCLIGIILAFGLFLSGCSYFSRFVIVNRSADYIDITYEVKDPKYKSLQPYFQSLVDFNNNENKWEKLPEIRYKGNSEKGIVEVQLAPGEVLQIESVDASEIQKNPYHEFKTKSLKITGKNGAISLEGNQVFENFKPEWKSWSIIVPSYPTYVLYYDDRRKE